MMNKISVSIDENRDSDGSCWLNEKTKYLGLFSLLLMRFLDKREKSESSENLGFLP